MWGDASNRYKTKITSIFSAENKLKLQLMIECKLIETLSELGIVDNKASEVIENAAKLVTLDRVHEIESEIHHDIMAMVKALSEKAGEYGQYVHYTATSNDINDTTLALQLSEAKTLILDNLDVLSENIIKLIENYKVTPTIGRTHGQHAIPTTIGFKFANYLYEIQLAKEEIFNSKIDISKFSGAVGNYASSNREDIERILLKKLNLEPAKISTQVLSRVVIAKFLTSIALGASVLERISKEIRNLQRSEINEWIEPFKSNQVGSSAMPHKRNPHKSERISGLSRIVRNNVSVALENISLEHERDITHSSVERIIIPASLNLFYFMVSEMNYILSNLEINLDSVNLNLMKSQGKDKSEEILTILSSKISRQEAHELLRNHVNSENFQLSVLDDTNITSLIDKEILKNIFANTKTGLSVGKTEDILKLYKSEWSNYRV